MMGVCAMPHVLDWWPVQMQSCADTHALGMSQGWFVALVSGLAGVALIALYCQRARLKRAKAEVGCTCCAALRCAVIYQLFNSCVVQYIAQCRYLSIPLSCHWMRQVATNLRIVLGAGQVLSLLSGVLKLVFPTEARAALGVVTIFVAGAPLSATGAGRFQLSVAHLTRLHALCAADVGSLVSLECQGWGWYGKWTLVVAGVPSLALLAIGVRWLQLRFGGCRARRLHVEPEVEVSVGRYVSLNPSCLYSYPCSQSALLRRAVAVGAAIACSPLASSASACSCLRRCCSTRR